MYIICHKILGSRSCLSSHHVFLCVFVFFTQLNIFTPEIRKFLICSSSCNLYQCAFSEMHQRYTSTDASYVCCLFTIFLLYQPSLNYPPTIFSFLFKDILLIFFIITNLYVFLISAQLHVSSIQA